MNRRTPLKRDALSLTTLLLLSLLLACGEKKELSGSLDLSGAWVGAVPPSAKATGAYFVIDNGTDQTQILEKVECALARRTELHDMRMEDEMMYMERVERVEIASGEKVEFKSGGMHAMLMGLTHVPQPGEEVTLILHFAGQEPRSLQAPVKKPGGH